MYMYIYVYIYIFFFFLWQSKRSSHHYQTLGFRNSTFFPSYRPKVLMDEDDDTSSIATDDTAGYASVWFSGLCVTGH